MKRTTSAIALFVASLFITAGVLGSVGEGKRSVRLYDQQHDRAGRNLHYQFYLNTMCCAFPIRSMFIF